MFRMFRYFFYIIYKGFYRLYIFTRNNRNIRNRSRPSDTQPFRAIPNYQPCPVIFSCFTFLSITWREASSLWISSSVMPCSIISTIT